MRVKSFLTRPWSWTVPVAALALAGFAFSCGQDEKSAPPLPQYVAPTHEIDRACASPIFTFGRAMSAGELSTFQAAKYELESVHFRDVVWRTPDDVAFAYHVDVKMHLAQDRFLQPQPSVACREENRPSKRAQKLGRTMVPVLGDLHLPSTRITVFDQASSDRDRLYNYPRISELTFSKEGYFSFNQNWAPYRKLQSLGQYLDHLRYRAFYDRVELREMGYGRVGVYAEKDVKGERAQLLIVLKH